MSRREPHNCPGQTSEKGKRQNTAGATYSCLSRSKPKEGPCQDVARPALGAAILAAIMIAVGLGATSPARSAGTQVTATGCTKSTGKLRYGIAGAGIAQLDPEHDQLRRAGAAPDAALQRAREVRPEHEGRSRPRNVVAFLAPT